MGKLHKIKRAFNRLSDEQKAGVAHRKTGGHFDENNHFYFDKHLSQSYRNYIKHLCKEWEEDKRVADVLDSMIPILHAQIIQPTLLGRVGQSDVSSS